MGYELALLNSSSLSEIFFFIVKIALRSILSSSDASRFKISNSAFLCTQFHEAARANKLSRHIPLGYAKLVNKICSALCILGFPNERSNRSSSSQQLFTYNIFSRFSQNLIKHNHTNSKSVALV